MIFHNKNFIKVVDTGSNLYTAVIPENEYKAGASKHFLEKLYNNSIQNMVAALYSNKTIKDSDVEELRNFLDKLEEGYSGKGGAS